MRQKLMHLTTIPRSPGVNFINSFRTLFQTFFTLRPTFEKLFTGVQVWRKSSAYGAKQFMKSTCGYEFQRMLFDFRWLRYCRWTVPNSEICFVTSKELTSQMFSSKVKTSEKKAETYSLKISRFVWNASVMNYFYTNYSNHLKTRLAVQTFLRLELCGCAQNLNIYKKIFFLIF